MASQTARPMNWNVDEGSGFVSIHNRDMFLSVRGPPRTFDQPVVVCEAGHGSTSHVWAGVQSQAGQFVRTFAYDRAGMGQSQPGPSPRTAAAAAQDLSDMLDAAQVPGPYLLVCHSYGGIPAREFLHLRNRDVEGIIFIDTITERYTAEAALPMADYHAVVGGLDFWEVSGLAARHVLTPEEFELLKKQWPNDEATAAAEADALPASERALAEKNQFGTRAMDDRPVVVMRGNATQEIRAVVEAGTAVGNGTRSQRAALNAFLETSEAIRDRHQSEQGKLSFTNRLVIAEHGYHMVPVTEPGLIAREIRIMLETLRPDEWRGVDFPWDMALDIL